MIIVCCLVYRINIANWREFIVLRWCQHTHIWGMICWFETRKIESCLWFAVRKMHINCIFSEELDRIWIIYYLRNFNAGYKYTELHSAHSAPKSRGAHPLVWGSKFPSRTALGRTQYRLMALLILLAHNIFLQRILATRLSHITRFPSSSDDAVGSVFVALDRDGGSHKKMCCEYFSYNSRKQWQYLETIKLMCSPVTSCCS